MGKSSLKAKYQVLILAYFLIPAFLPNLGALDSNIPKFLAISLLNCVSFIVMVLDPEFRPSRNKSAGILFSPLGIAYGAFILISLLSLIQAINPVESLLRMSQIGTVFLTAWILGFILRKESRYLQTFLLGLGLLFLYDSFLAFSHLFKYISREIYSISEIISPYSNKNIFAAAIFIKIPAALWLMTYSGRFVKRLAQLGLILGVFSIFVLSTRAFYLGLGVLVFVLFLIGLIQYTRSKTKLYLQTAGQFLGLVGIALLAFTLTQKTLYPKDQDIHFNQDVASRISTVLVKGPTNMRLESWRNSAHLIHEHPILGVGIGNWKVAILKYENQEKTNFTYMNRAHNDFIEFTAETGILGGLSFLAVFIIVFFTLGKSLYKRSPDERRQRILYLSGLGLLAYSVDAFFNFPASRPEIQILFAAYLAIGFSAFDPVWPPKSKKTPALLSIGAGSFVTIFLLTSSYLLFLNTQSLKIQSKVKKDIQHNQYTLSASYLLSAYPSIPNINGVGGPIVIDKVRYLMKENRHRESVDLLLADQASPYDGRKEFYLGMNYLQLGMTDSALYNLELVHQIKPNFLEAGIVLGNLLCDQGKVQEAEQIIQDLLDKTKDQPDNQDLISLQKKIKRNKLLLPHLELYTRANALFNEQHYSEALPLIDELIRLEPMLQELFKIRAYCLYFTGQFQACQSDINHYLDISDYDPQLINLRGECFIGLNEKEQACADFKKASDSGLQEAEENYVKYCVQILQKD